MPRIFSLKNCSSEIRQAPDTEGKKPHLPVAGNLDVPSYLALASKRYRSSMLYFARPKKDRKAHSAPDPEDCMFDAAPAFSSCKRLLGKLSLKADIQSERFLSSEYPPKRFSVWVSNCLSNANKDCRVISELSPEETFRLFGPTLLFSSKTKSEVKLLSV